MAFQFQKQFINNDVMRHVARLDRQIRFGIIGAAIIQKALERGFGILRVQHGPIGALAHTPQQDIDIGFEPDRHGFFSNALSGLLGLKRAAARGDHHLLVIEQAGNNPPFAFAELFFAMLGKNFGNGHAGRRFNGVIGVRKIQGQTLRQATPDRAFTSPHHADQNHRPALQCLSYPRGPQSLAGFIRSDFIHTRHPKSKRIVSALLFSIA